MGNFKFPKLTPHNYATWSIKMWCHLMHNVVSQYLDGTLPKPVGDNVLASDILAWDAMDRKALGDICLGVDDKIMYQIKKCTTSKEAWHTLKSLYDKVFDEDIFKIEDELISLDPKSFDSIQDFIIKVNELRTKLTNCGNPIKDDRLIYLTHNKLPSEYSTCVSSYNTSKTTLGSAYKKVSFDEYAKLLDDEEKKLISMKILTSPKSKALVANNNGSSNSTSLFSNKGKGNN